METVESEFLGGFASLSPADRERVFEFMCEHFSMRHEDLNDYNVKPIVEENGDLTVFTNGIASIVETDFVCFRCLQCGWISGDDPTAENGDVTESLEHAMKHLGLLGDK